jgi:uncharacterized membrane protein YdjX (TVP38/TMEM64 family)
MSTTNQHKQQLKEHSSVLSTTSLTTTTSSSYNVAAPNDNDTNDVEVQQHNEEPTSTNTDPQDDEEEKLHQKEKRRSCYIKIIVGLILVGFITFVVIDSQTNRYVRNGITVFLEWIQQNPGAGVVAFMLVYFVATILFVPGSLLTLGAGFVFSASFGSLAIGVLLASISVFVGASTGAIAAFVLGRYLLRDAVGRLSAKYSTLQALDSAIEEKGFQIMLLLRLSPIIPFNVINYIASATAISFWNYCAACIGILPGTVLYCFLGASAGSLADSASSGDSMTITIVVVVVGVVFGIGAIALTSYYAKKELNKVIQQQQQQNTEDIGGEQTTTSVAEGSQGNDEEMGVVIVEGQAQ